MAGGMNQPGQFGGGHPARQGQPMQRPMQGQPVQRPPMQGQPMQRPPMQGQPMQRPPMQGQPMQMGHPPQPGYGPPPGYGAPMGYAAPGQFVDPNATNPIAMWAMICGIAPVVLSFIPYVNVLGLVSMILAIVFGFIGLSKSKRIGGKGRGMAITGIVLGFVWIGLALIGMLLLATVLATMFGAAGAGA